MAESPCCTLEDLARLAEAERDVLMGMAGLGLPVGNSHLARALAAAGVPRGRAWARDPRQLVALLEGLRAQGLAEATRQGCWTCAGRCLESAARLAAQQGWLRRLYQAALAGSTGSVAPDPHLRRRAELRLAFLEERPERWLALRAELARACPAPYRLRDPLAPICGSPFEPAWFDRLQPPAQAYGCQALLQDQVLAGRPEPAFLAWLEDRSGVPRPVPAALPILQYLVLQGRFPAARAWLQAVPGLRRAPSWPALAGLAALGAGVPPGPPLDTDPPAGGLGERLHLLGLLALGTPRGRERAQERVARLGETGPLDRALGVLAAHLGGRPVTVAQADQARAACAGLPLAWLSAELEELARRLQGDGPRPSSLLDRAPRKASWERALEEITRLGGPAD